MTRLADDGTVTAMESPLPGFRFHENHSFWIEVVAIGEGVVAVREVPPTLGMDHEYRFFRSADAFRRAYSYREGGYWIRWEDAKGMVWEGTPFSLMVKALNKESCSPKELDALLEDGGPNEGARALRDRGAPR